MSVSEFLKLFDEPGLSSEEQRKVVENCEKTGDPILDGHIHKFRISDEDGKIEALIFIDRFADAWWTSGNRVSCDFPVWSE